MGNSTQPFMTSQNIVLSEDVLNHSHLHVNHDFERKFQNPRLDRKNRRLSKSAARRAVALARATRLAIKTRERSLSARIAEVEQYIGLLRQKRAVVRNRGVEADEQMGMALGVLHQQGITEQALSDYEPDDEDEDEFLNDRFYPPSSDLTQSDGVLSDNYPSSNNSDCDTSSALSAHLVSETGAPSTNDHSTANTRPSRHDTGSALSAHLVSGIGAHSTNDHSTTNTWPSRHSAVVDSGHGGSIAEQSDKPGCLLVASEHL